MKKKLEAELISIAHRILKLKNRAEIEQLQQETLKLYEKLSVLRFVEDNFRDVRPTIGYASAEEKLEEIYGLEEQPVEQKHAEPETAKTDDIKGEEPAVEQVNAEDFEKNTDEEKQDKESDSGEGVDTTGTDESPASDEEVKHVEEETDEEVKPADESDENEVQPEAETSPVTEQKEEPKQEEPKAEEKPQLNFEQKPEEPKKQKEITFEDFHDYKEPEFIKKSDLVEPTSISKEFLPKEPEIIAKQEEKAETMWEEPKQEEKKAEPKREEPVRDWRDWEPSTSPYASKPAEELKRSLNDAAGKTITLGLNDRIAFEKHLFGGSSEDLNRVLSQLNTLNSYSEARNFINDLVKPDYNDWKNKDEYEERFMDIVEKRFH